MAMASDMVILKGQNLFNLLSPQWHDTGSDERKVAFVCDDGEVHFPLLLITTASPFVTSLLQSTCCSCMMQTVLLPGISCRALDDLRTLLCYGQLQGKTMEQLEEMASIANLLCIYWDRDSCASKFSLFTNTRTTTQSEQLRGVDLFNQLQPAVMEVPVMMEMSPNSSVPTYQQFTVPVQYLQTTCIQPQAQSTSTLPKLGKEFDIPIKGLLLKELDPMKIVEATPEEPPKKYNKNAARASRVGPNDKPYECTICQRRFSRKDTLTEHLKVHSDIKPFLCSFCQKKFRRKAHLLRHVRIHSVAKGDEAAALTANVIQCDALPDTQNDKSVVW